MTFWVFCLHTKYLYYTPQKNVDVGDTTKMQINISKTGIKGGEENVVQKFLIKHEDLPSAERSGPSVMIVMPVNG